MRVTLCNRTQAQRRRQPTSKHTYRRRSSRLLPVWRLLPSPQSLFHIPLQLVFPLNPLVSSSPNHHSSLTLSLSVSPSLFINPSLFLTPQCSKPLLSLLRRFTQSLVKAFLSSISLVHSLLLTIAPIPSVINSTPPPLGGTTRGKVLASLLLVACLQLSWIYYAHFSRRRYIPFFSLVFQVI